MLSLAGLSRGVSSGPVAGVVVYELGSNANRRTWLATSALDGSDRHSVMAPARYGERTDREMVLSPDGSKVAFVRNSTGGNALLVASVAGGTLRRLAGAKELGGPIHVPIWSPDGAKIAFAGGNCTSSRASLYSVDPDGSNLTALPSVPGALKSRDRLQLIVPEAWSEDGRMILYGLATWSEDCFLDQNFESESLFTIEGDGTGRTAVIDSKGAFFMKHAAWSPDGRWIAFSSADNPSLRANQRSATPCALSMVKPDGKARRLLVRYDHGDGATREPVLPGIPAEDRSSLAAPGASSVSTSRLNNKPESSARLRTTVAGSPPMAS
jgi:Tol biopolymer transport system component